MPYHYHYDKDSFLAGLAAGRALWQPPDYHAERWTCDPAYRVYFAGTDLGYSADRHFYKTSDGLAVGVYAKGWRAPTGPWYGPILISTNPNAVRYYYGSTHLTYSGTFQYMGLTWYLNWEHHFQNPRSYGYGALTPWNAGSYANGRELGRAILDLAGVRTY